MNVIVDNESWLTASITKTKREKEEENKAERGRGGGGGGRGGGGYTKNLQTFCIVPLRFYCCCCFIVRLHYLLLSQIKKPISSLHTFFFLPIHHQ